MGTTSSGSTPGEAAAASPHSAFAKPFQQFCFSCRGLHLCIDYRNQLNAPTILLSLLASSLFLYCAQSPAPHPCTACVELWEGKALHGKLLTTGERDGAGFPNGGRASLHWGDGGTQGLLNVKQLTKKEKPTLW